MAGEALEIEEDALPVDGIDDAGTGVVTEEEEEEESTPAVVVPPPRRKAPARPVARPAGEAAPRLSVASPLQRAMRGEEEVVAAWLEEIGGAGEVHFQVSRTEPETYQGVKTSGVLKTYYEPITIDKIQQDHGGGTFCIRIRRRNGTNKMVWNGSKNVQIAGVPKLDPLRQRDEEEERAKQVASGAAPPTPAGPGLGDRAFDLAVKMMEQKGQAAPPPPQQQVTPEMIDAWTRPYRDALERMEAQMDRAAQVRERPSVEDDLQKSILGKLIDNDSARMTALRMEHESELRQLKENHREDEKRAQAAWDRERDRLVSDAARQADMLTKHHELVMMSVRSNLEGQNAFQAREISRLERELGQSKGEVEALRAKKDKTPFEIVKEVEAMRDLFGTGEDDKEKTSGVERVIGKALESPIVQGLADRIMSNIGPTSAEQQAQQPQMQVGKPFRGDDGQIYVHNGTGIVPFRRKKKQAAVQAAAGEATGTPEEQAAEAAAEADVPNIDPQTIATVVGFMEGAFARGTEPEVMAQSIKTQVPGDILAYIGTHSVDAFLDKVASLPKTSPLAQQAGRNWVRKLAKALLAE